ncbi:MAG: extracellular solute-binding protein [Acidobacteriia bacterium]|nr:extracellular solute-binding protein [Terriglobia bacterium]
MRVKHVFLLIISMMLVKAPTADAQQSVPKPSDGALTVYHAGSLTAAFQSVEAAFKKEHPGVQVVDKSFGSVDMARRVTSGGESADILATADYTNIDSMLKPKYAAYTIRFAQGGMVLMYRADDTNQAAGVNEIADPAIAYNPNTTPPSIPNVKPNWYTYLTRPGVHIAGADPAADPGGYRAVMIMQLAEAYYREPGLYQRMRDHYTITSGAAAPASDFRFSYESSALAAARQDSAVRLARLPAEVALSDSAKSAFYHKAVVSIPALFEGEPPIKVEGTRATWGITILNMAKNRANAVAFLEFLLNPGKGAALQKAAGPEPIIPALVSKSDHERLPEELRSLVRAAKE